MATSAEQTITSLPSPTPFDLCISLYRAHKSLLNLRKLISQGLGGEYVKAISPLERFMVLSLLEKYPVRSQKWLSRRSGMSPTELAKVMLHLESVGLVERMYPADRRLKLSRLTLEGKNFLDLMNQPRLAGIDASTLVPLLDRLQHIVDNAAHERPGEVPRTPTGISINTSEAA